MKNRIRSIRDEQGIKQRELAAACDMDSAHLSRIENGHVDPTLGTAKRIADQLGRSVEDVFEFGGESEEAA